MKFLIALAWSMALSLAQDPAPEPGAKARLLAALQATGLVFETSASGGSHVLTFDHEGGRQQKVFVLTQPARAGNATTHLVFTNVWIDPKRPPDAALVRRLFARAKRFGAFYSLQMNDGGFAIRFGVHFDATALPATAGKDDPLVRQLGDLIRFVDAVGEETDREVNGDRDLR